MSRLARLSHLSSFRNYIACCLLLASFVLPLQVWAVDAAGSLDTSFTIGTGANSGVNAFAIQPDGKILIGGALTSYNGVTRNRLARLNPDGSLDSSFDPDTGPDNNISSMVIQPDGKIIIGGSFTSYRGIARSHIARLNVDGSLDASFNPGSGVGGTLGIYSVALQVDGKILIGGNFQSYNGVTRYAIARLNADGSLDGGFNAGNAANGPVCAVSIQKDGKILAGGQFTNGVYDIVRLNTDGTRDISFSANMRSQIVYTIAIQPDGKIIVGGIFTKIDGVTVNRIARLNVDGSRDTSFNPGIGANDQVNSALVQPDGKMLIGGWFTSYNGTAKNYIARLNSDGSLDTSFDSGSGSNAYAVSLAIQADGKLLVGGSFTSYNGTPANSIMRINTGDQDGDGAEDAADYFPANAAESADNDRDGIGDNADLDDDNDGVLDYLDPEPLNPANSTKWPLSGNYKGSSVKEYNHWQ